MGQQARIRVLVMHGEHLIDAGLAATLSGHRGCEVVTPDPRMPRGDDLLAWMAGQGVDVVVTDYDRGVWLAQALQRASAPLHAATPRTMIVTGRVTQAEIRTALKRGVRGYLTVLSPSHEIVDAVREVHMGARHVSAPLARSLLEDMLCEQLTPRESEVLRLAAQGCANKVIAARLRVELGTVKSHMKAVMEKLHAGNRTEAVVIASQRGLLALDRSRPGTELHAAPTPWAAHPAVAPGFAPAGA